MAGSDENPVTPNEYECDDCGYVYLPSEHSGLDLDDQADWTCPDCQASRDHFHLIVPSDEDLTEDDHTEEVTTTDGVRARKMYTDESDPTVHDLHRRKTKGRLDTQPDFQRYEVWSRSKNSRLIESVILDLPVPQIFLAQEPDKSVVVIDGQQRLMALFRFMDNEYALKDVHKDLVGKKFESLDSDLQDTIEEYNLSTITILKESDPEIKFELFRRLNEGSTSLNDQELRNSVHRGPYNDFLKTIAGEDDWRKILNLTGKEAHKRMVDVELALRYMAFRDQTYMKHPDKKTSKFLDDQMVIGAGHDKRELEKAKKDFRTSTALALTVYGRNACRRFVAGDEENPQGRWDRRINRALMDVQLWGFQRRPKGDFVANADRVREASVELMSSDVFTDLITHTISEARRVERRFDMWKQMIDDVLTAAPTKRFFPRSVKESLFTKNSSCAICGQRILEIEDAHVDHKKPFGKGGTTDEINAQLAHQYCNLRKGDTDEEE